MATMHEETHLITRLTFTIPKPFDSVLAKLHSSIRKDPKSKPLTILSSPNKEIFESSTHSFLGPHDFMQFQIFDHGSWLTHYGIERKCVRVIFGNPLIAITMLRHDLKAGLDVPVQALVVEREDGGTDVVWVRPSSLIAGHQGASEEVREAAQVLDGKVERLWGWVASDDDGKAVL